MDAIRLQNLQAYNVVNAATLLLERSPQFRDETPRLHLFWQKQPTQTVTEHVFVLVLNLKLLNEPVIRLRLPP